MSLQAVMKRLDVLSDTGLVSRAKTGHVVACRLDAEPMRDASMAQPLRKVLVQAAIQSRRIFGKKKNMSTQAATRPNLTLKRRFKAPPGKGLAA